MVTTTVSEKVENFIQSLGLPEVIAKGVLRSVEDCQNFYIGFYGRNRYVTDDLLDYRENKIASSNISLHVYLGMCEEIGLLNAFEETFLQSFTEDDIQLVTNAVVEGKITLEEIYLDFKKNPNKNILKNVL